MSSAEAVAPISGLRKVKIAHAEPASTEVARALLEYILSGHIGPGEKLPSERQLSESLGVGRGVVREGVKSLGLLGLVEFRHGGGTYLRSVESDLLPRVIEWGLLLGEQRVTDLIEARQRIEEIIAELAAQRRTAAQLGRIEGALEAMRTAVDTKAFVAADVEFHLAVAAASNNGALANMHSSIASLLHVWIDRVMHAADSFEPSYLEHVPILEAIRAQDAQGAFGAAHEHMHRASARLVDTLKRRNDSPEG